MFLSTFFLTYLYDEQDKDIIETFVVCDFPKFVKLLLNTKYGDHIEISFHEISKDIANVFLEEKSKLSPKESNLLYGCREDDVEILKKTLEITNTYPSKQVIEKMCNSGKLKSIHFLLEYPQTRYLVRDVVSDYPLLLATISGDMDAVVKCLIDPRININFRFNGVCL